MDTELVQKLKNLLKDLPAISTATVNSGDTTTDTVINNIRSFCNQLKANIAGQ
jgi:hypothetical protein